MKTIRKFIPADRYIFDFRHCSIKKGFAQVDTSQDASYFGMWANPERLMIVGYAEGDVTIQTADNVNEFVEEIRSIKKWNIENGYRFLGIDPGLNDRLAERFNDIGLSDMVY